MNTQTARERSETLPGYFESVYERRRKIGMNDVVLTNLFPTPSLK